MKRLALASLIAISIGHGTITYAQNALVGTYRGSYPVFTSMGGVQVGVQLIIASDENGIVKGTATTYSKHPCAGTYPMEGKRDGNNLVLIATAKGGRAGDCSFRLNLAQEANKLVGTTGLGNPIELSK